MNDKRVCTIAERLQEYMEYTGEKQVDMLEKIEPVARQRGEKFNKSHLSNYLNGRFVPKPNKIFVMAEGLGVDPEWLMGYNVPMRKSENPDFSEFAVIAPDDSMIGARILEGDTVFIRPHLDTKNGDIVAVVIKEEVVLRRIYRIDDEVVLQAENPSYLPMIFRGEERGQIQILGKAVEFRSKIE